MTQMSEQLNAQCRFYLGPELNLCTFFSRFEALVAKLRHNELTDDYNMINRIPPNRHQNIPIMTHAADVFTPEIFYIFQDQYE